MYRIDGVRESSSVDLHEVRLISMNRLTGTKILLIIAVWLLTGGLSLADSFDLTDELQNSLLDRTFALETDLDEVRESVEEGVAPLAYLVPDITRLEMQTVDPPVSFDLLVKEAMRPLQEVLQTFRI
jgi:hypothetical protein